MHIIFIKISKIMKKKIKSKIKKKFKLWKKIASIELKDTNQCLSILKKKKLYLAPG